ncbi:hypothetical protein ILUMI_00691 [Ignelater luminosus]|uniref:Uncharacterized protein n=1 Tax=Ignelater luminosus TaxID=2038154 RepID=A0A8K0DJP9_IGNLU|nr:hypothetical protein ILUMI_00691 [Ignelater luminosus]
MQESVKSSRVNCAEKTESVPTPHKNTNKPSKIYLADQIAEQYGHKVVRLPTYHCIFNPIELIWEITKNYYNRHIGRDGGGIELLNMSQEALQTATAEVWQNAITHTEDEISI